MKTLLLNEVWNYYQRITEDRIDKTAGTFSNDYEEIYGKLIKYDKRVFVKSEGVSFTVEWLFYTEYEIKEGDKLTNDSYELRVIGNEGISPYSKINVYPVRIV